MKSVVLLMVALGLLATASDARAGGGEKAAAKLAAAIDADDATAVLALLAPKVEIEGKKRTRAWVKQRIVEAGTVRGAFEIQACAWEVSAGGRDTTTWCAGDREREVVTVFRIRKGKVRAITREAGDQFEITSGLDPSPSVFNEVEGVLRPRLRIGAPAVSGPLAADVVHRYLKRYLLSRVTYCYELARAKAPDLAGRVALELEIDADGAATVTGATPLHPDVDACLVDRVAAMALPRADGVTSVGVLLTFDVGY